MKSTCIDLSNEEARQKFYNTYPFWATMVAEIISKVTNHDTKIWFRETSIYGILYMKDITSGMIVTKKMPINEEARTTRNPQ